MATEIERKFLVDRAVWHQYNKGEGKVYRQGYIVNEPGSTVRIRTAGSKGFITIKGKTSGFSRPEYEYEIPLNEAEELLNGFCDQLIVKTRYIINHEGHAWEVDVFAGDNEGLIVAEIELLSEEETFCLPVFIGTEVTQDARYFNANLSVHPYSKWNER